MKKITTYFLSLLTTLCLLPSCDSGFDELNVSKTSPVSLNPAFLMNNAIVLTSFPLETIVFEIPVVQQIVTPFGGVLGGGNFNQDNRPRNGGNWVRYYRDVIKSLADVINQTQNDENLTNLYNSARIWKAFAFMILTDSYGDVPYFEAGNGFIEGLSLPKYDPQQAIYTDILKELEEASAAMDAGKPIVASDVLYNGDVALWKSFGYSVMLRAAMRLSKVDQTLAQQYVTKAVAGGVIQTNLQSGVVRHTSLYNNAIGAFVNGSEANNYYLAGPFVDYLKANNDPRLKSIAVRYVGAASGPQQTPANAKFDAALQIGMPMGYDNGTIVAKATADGLASFYDYSQLDRFRMGKIDAPCFLVTNAQTKLLLAEAVVRGWTSGNAAELYEQGIRAHMAEMTQYHASSSIAVADIDAYIAAHPYNAGNALRDINTQYWVASFLNGPEAFSNFRRSGFPALTPNPYPGKDISTDFIRKLTYPDTELGINKSNVDEAIARQGGNLLDTRVWWDKQ
ncbi:MAG TPA: SusD/RagB family nutrient-binding outer membrane lipoprotein [Chryseolinea sp.]|nr:SusD/RagB family nutrient-binding outer membrane lipoprotein [Chryseolinea sp.]